MSDLSQQLEEERRGRRKEKDGRRSVILLLPGRMDERKEKRGSEIGSGRGESHKGYRVTRGGDLGGGD